MEEILLETETRMESAIDNLNKRLTNIRAGRANPAMLDSVMVSYYGVDTPLKQLATISVPEARMLQIKPYDRSSIGLIEKAIFEANIGLTPNNNGEVVILNIPAMTEETRREYVKQAKAIGEEAKIALRNIRQDANNDIKKLEIPEDEIKAGQDEVQELINKFNKIVDAYNERTDIADIEKIIEEMIKLKKEIEDELEKGNEYDLSSEEKAFFDALGADPEIKELIKDETLVQIAKELVEIINENLTLDAFKREDARARIRVNIRRLLIKYNYPPVKREGAVEQVIRQAELKYSQV